jgi:hypothetical protein
MLFFLGKTLLAALILSFCSWLSGKKPELAGFLISLPISTLIVLLFSYYEYKDSKQTVLFAKSIFVGVPLSLTFFLPFLVAERFQLNFFICYIVGIMLIILGFFVHKFILGMGG